MGTAVAVGAAVYNVATAPDGQKLQTAASEGGGLAGAVAGGELGAETGAFAGPWGALGGGLIGSIGGGIAGKSAVEQLMHPGPQAPDSDGHKCEGCGWVK